MLTRLKYTGPEQMFLGRNGFGRATGIDIMNMNDGIEISPITSKGIVGRCYIQVPLDDIPELIKILREYSPE